VTKRATTVPLLPPPGVRPLPSAAAIVGQAGRDLSVCGFCGADSLMKNGLCRGHDDLGGKR
jgi:hypothetical protein